MKANVRGRRPPRRRRTKDEAEAEILAAAERFLEQRSWHDLTVEGVMELTTMTRMAFYHYFDDRRALFLALMQRVGEDLTQMTSRWFEGHGALYDDALATLTGTAEVYCRHGRLIRASTEAAAEDTAIREVREAIILAFIDRTETWLEHGLSTGDLPPLADQATPRGVAEALVSMGDAYMQRCYGWDGERYPIEAVAGTLLQIWVGALYQVAPAALRDRERI